jgi:hypothetical protein
MLLSLLSGLAIAVVVILGVALCWDMYADARDGLLNPFRGLMLGILFILGFVLLGGVFESVTDLQSWQLRK